MRLVCQMRLACKYLNQTHFLPEIVNSRANESRNTYLNPFRKQCQKHLVQQMRLVNQMRLACKYLNQTHFIVEILNSRGSETRDAYLNPFGEH